MGLKRRLFVLLASASLVGALFPAAASAAGPGPVPTSYPRDQTLYTSGTMYGPPTDFNPVAGGYVTGTFGLLYESLFLYNPLSDKFIPWLAQSGSWTGAKTYTLKLRSGLTWSDGTPLTSADVVYTFDLGKLASVPYSTLWNFLQSVTAVDDLTVQFTFSKALYQEWSNSLYTVAIVPAHVWGTRTVTDVLTYNTSPNAAAGVVGSGPYELLTYDQTKVVWVKNDAWWGTSLLGLDVKPTYIVDEVNGSNNVELGQVLAGTIDLSNNFLPGINSIVSGIGGYGIQTYYPKPPYMLSANTAWLVTNNVKKPTNDPVFRRALAESINVSQIVNNVYGQIVQAANPTGLLPTWNQFVDKSVVAKYGYTYNPTDARKILTAAGYKMGSDGYFRNKDGSVINLSSDRAERLDGLDGSHPVDRPERQGGRDQDHSELPLLQRQDEQGPDGQLRPGDRERRPDRQHPLGVLPVDVPPADPGHAGRGQRWAVQELNDLDPGRAARRDADKQRCRDEEDHLPDPDDPAAEPADHPAVVQRGVGAGG